MHKTLSGLLLASAIGLYGWAGSAGADGKPPEGHPPLSGLLLDGPAGPDAPLPHGFGPGFGPGTGAGPGIGPGMAAGGAPHEVIQTLLEIERLYREQGRPKEVVALYQDVLGKTRDPLVRHFAYEAIAHAQLQPADTDKAVATLKQSLDESLQHLNELPPPGTPAHDGGPGRDNISGVKAP